MYGLEAISHHNGWAMAIVGLSIVFSGLTVLSLIIAQLHKVLDLWENRRAICKKWFAPHGKKEKEGAEMVPRARLGGPEMRESYRHMGILAATLPAAIPLPRLLSMAKARGIFRCHTALADLIRARVLVPDGAGYYRWEEETFKELMED